MRPQPDVTRFFTVGETQAFGKSDNKGIIETFVRESRAKVKTHLGAKLSDSGRKQATCAFEHAVIRLAMNKAQINSLAQQRFEPWGVAAN